MDVWTIFKTLSSYFLTNCEIFFVTLLFSIPLGLFITFGTMSKTAVIRKPLRILVWIIRGTPLMLQLFVFLYTPGLLGHPISSRKTAAYLAMIINYAAYFSEIYRGGIQSIPKGQYEAGQVLGLTKRQTFMNVILLQVVKRIIPSMGNEVITLVKDTALVRVIGVAEIIMSAERYSAKGVIWPLFFTGVYFLLATAILTLLISKLEQKLDYFKG